MVQFLRELIDLKIIIKMDKLKLHSLKKETLRMNMI